MDESPIRKVIRESHEKTQAEQHVPTFDVWISPGGEEIALQAARDAGVTLNIKGSYATKGTGAPLHLICNLDEWLKYVGIYLGVKVLDGAIGEIGAEGSRRLAKLVREFRTKSPTPKSAVWVSAKDRNGVERRYIVSMPDSDPAVNAILADLGVPLADWSGGVSQRAWIDGHWIDLSEYLNK
jgi:hypothetical protein